jgi:hypothetical protein
MEELRSSNENARTAMERTTDLHKEETPNAMNFAYDLTMIGNCKLRRADPA